MNIIKLCILNIIIPAILVSATEVNAADPVTLNITGNIVASPCQISSDSVTKSIDLGQNIAAATLQSAGSSTSWVNFDINVSNCPSGTTNVTMTMHGTADTSKPQDTYISTGTAKNVAVELNSQTGNIQLGNGKTITGTISNNAYDFKLMARMYSSAGNATPGTVNATVTATFVYQ